MRVFRKHPMLWVLAFLGLIIFIGSNLQSGSSGVTSNVITKTEAEQAARNFLRDHQVDTAPLLWNAQYVGHHDMEGYIARQKLEKKYDQAHLDQAPLDYWSVTAKNTAQTDNSYEVWVDDGGRVVGFSLPLVRDDTKVTPSRTMQAVAKSAFTKLGYDTANWVYNGEVRIAPSTNSFFGVAQTERLPRQEFRWMDPKGAIGQAFLQYRVQMLDDRVVAMYYTYSIPSVDQDWLIAQEGLSTKMTMISLLGTGLLLVWAVIIVLMRRRDGVDWGRGALLSVWLFGFLLLTSMNEWPDMLSHILVSADMPSAMERVAVFVVLTAVLTAGATYLMGVAGGTLQQEMNPTRWLPIRDPDWGQRLKDASTRGYLLAAVLLGAQAILYLVGERFLGVWYINDPSSDPGNLLAPALMPAMAWVAGINEEVIYRLFGVTVFKRLLKNSALALLLPAMIWALGHSMYPVYPFYSRFLEVTVLGLIFGYAFLRYDLETVIFAHVVFDSLLMSLPLVFGGQPVEMIMGVFWIALPWLVGHWAGPWLRRSRHRFT